MSTREIPSTQWQKFCTAFTAQHQGWLANVETIAAKNSRRVEAQAAPFAGIRCQTKAGKNEIAIAIDRTVRQRAQRIIAHPAHLRVEQSRQIDQAIEVESRDGTKTIVRFINSPSSREELIKPRERKKA